ncbi:MAG: aminopeptidase P family protein [Candidatus Caldipriscus sp.]
MKLEELREKWGKRYDAYLVWKPEFVSISDLRYLTGFSGSTGIFLQTKNKDYLIVDFRYKEQSRKEVKGVEVVDIPYGKTQFEVLADILKGEGVRKVAVEGYTPLGYIKSLKKHAKGIRFLTVSGFVSSLRSRKTSEEIEKIKKAQEITDKLFDWLLNNLKPGKQTEREVAFEMERWAKTNGAEGMSFEPIVAGNERSSMPHARATENLIPERGVLILDFGVRYMGYCSDMTRTIWIGNKTDEIFERAYRVVLEAQERAINALRFKGGRKASDIDKVARDFIESSEFKGKFGHGLGHGVGLDIHEAPYLSPKSRDVLRGNEVVTVEPGIYLEGKFGIRIEDIVIAGKGEVITRSRKDIIRL